MGVILRSSPFIVDVMIWYLTNGKLLCCLSFSRILLKIKLLTGARTW